MGRGRPARRAGSFDAGRRSAVDERDGSSRHLRPSHDAVRQDPVRDGHHALTLATRNANRLKAQAGNLGDIGYNVSSAAKKIGGPLVGDKAVLKRATFNKQSLVVEFETLGELAVQSFQVVAKDRRGATSVVATVECVQCSSGIGSDYRVEVPGTALRNTKSVFVVVQPSGTVSNEIEISQQTQRPETTGRTTR